MPTEGQPERRGARTRAALLLLPVFLVVLGGYLRTLAEGAFAAFTDYETPFDFPAAPLPPARPATSSVMVLLVDGLGLEPSRQMRVLGELRARGADYAAQVGLPSLSQPGRGVLFSGASQEVHGQATNFKPRPLRVEHLFQVVRRAGRSTALSGMGEGVQKLFTPHVERKLTFEEPPETATMAVYEETARRMAEAARGLAGEKRAFMVAELLVVDEAGHNWGGASEQYRQAAQMVDGELERLVASLDLTRTTLVVTADHGHVAEGGHGGPEPAVMQVPLVMVGAGIRPGVSGTCSQRDLASTIAVLLGVDIPASNQGRPLLDALQLDTAGRVDALRRLYAQRRAFVQRYVAWVREKDAERLETAEAHLRTEADLQAALDGLDTLAAEARDERLALDARVRSRLSLVLVLLPLLVAGVVVAARAATGGELLEGVGWGLAAAALYHALLPLLGLGYSFTAVNKDSSMEPFFLKDMLAGAVCCALAVAAAAWKARRRGAAGLPWESARVAWLVAGGFCYVLVLKVAFIYWRHGVFLKWSMPDMYWSFGFYLDALALMAAAFASPLLPLVAWAVLRVGSAPPTESARAA